MNPKIQISETGSKLLQQPNAAVVEITVEDFSRILRQHFQIMNERGTKSYAVRYIGKAVSLLQRRMQESSSLCTQ